MPAKKKNTPKKNTGKKRTARKATKKQSKKKNKNTTGKAATRKKPAAKKQTPKRVNTKVKKEISRAVEAIPNLVTREASQKQNSPVDLRSRYESEAAEKAAEKSKVVGYHRAPRHSGVLLWIGVISISVIIFAMWILNARTFVFDVVNSKGQEGQLWNQASGDLSAILASVSEEGETAIEEETENIQEQAALTDKYNEEAKQKIRQGLAALVTSSSAATVSSTLPTSTPDLPED